MHQFKYQDGTVAKVGDAVVGPAWNEAGIDWVHPDAARLIAGRVVGVGLGAAQGVPCSLRLATLETRPAEYPGGVICSNAVYCDNPENREVPALVLVPTLWFGRAEEFKKVA